MNKLIFALLLLSLSACKKEAPQANNKLMIPPLIDSRTVDGSIRLTLQNGQHEFFAGVKSHTKGFNGDYLGPTIRLYNKDSTRIQFTNRIGEATTVHGHGLHVEGRVDGGPQNKILPNEIWDIILPIDQEASTNWYHPHLMGKTAEHVHAGLAGLYLVEDDNSMQLPLPKQYGVDDIPLIVQDRDFVEGEMVDYSATENELMDGKRGKTLVINGTVNPYIEVPKGWLRLRLLNGSNARFYEFYLKNEQAFYKIATEGGFLEKPVAITKLTMAPGERNEIMINLSDGVTRELMAILPPADNEGVTVFSKKERILEIRVDPTATAPGSLPTSLNTIRRLKKEDVDVVRTFTLEMEMDEGADVMCGTDRNNMFCINGKPMNRKRIDEKVNIGATELWRITGDMMEHPFHMHGTSFLILSQNGNPPLPEDQGWKDVVIVDGGWTEVIMQFNYEATEEFPYMYHCHILEHEDAGMMGQFTVE
ncbi:MAG: multicopper oxidase domain-containing protein [Bacteroidota bacterium]